MPSPGRTRLRHGEKQSSQKKRAIGAVVFGSDQGLVGRFNEVVVEFAVRHAQSLTRQDHESLGGRRAHPRLHGGCRHDAGRYIVRARPRSTPYADSSARFSSKSKRLGKAAMSVEVYLFHNHPKSGSVYEPVSKRLLPLDHAWQKQACRDPGRRNCLPEVIDGTTSPLAGIHSRIPVCPAVSGVRRIPCQRKRQPSWRRCNARRRTSKKFWKI